MNLKLLVLFGLLFICPEYAQGQHVSIDSSVAQHSVSKVANDQSAATNRKWFWTGSIGLFEHFNFGFGIQINEKLAFSVKYGATWLSHGGNGYLPGSGKGIEAEATCYLDLWLFSNFSLRYLPYCETSGWYNDGWSFKQKGKYIECNLGNQSIKKSVNGQWTFFWSMGIGISTPRKMPTLILPTFNLGYLYSF